MYYHKGTFYHSYPSYCIAYWSLQKSEVKQSKDIQTKEKQMKVHTTKSKPNVKTSIFIDTTLSILSIHGIFHPYSPRPTRYPRFLFTITLPLQKTRGNNHLDPNDRRICLGDELGEDLVEDLVEDGVGITL